MPSKRQNALQKIQNELDAIAVRWNRAETRGDQQELDRLWERKQQLIKAKIAVGSEASA